jgi:hypothetical protein
MLILFLFLVLIIDSIEWSYGNKIRIPFFITSIASNKLSDREEGHNSLLNVQNTNLFGRNYPMDYIDSLYSYLNHESAAVSIEKYDKNIRNVTSYVILICVGFTETNKGAKILNRIEPNFIALNNSIRHTKTLLLPENNFNASSKFDALNSSLAIRALGSLSPMLVIYANRATISNNNGFGFVADYIQGFLDSIAFSVELKKGHKIWTERTILLVCDDLSSHLV